MTTFKSPFAVLASATRFRRETSRSTKMIFSKWHLPRRTFRLKKSPPESVECEAAGLSASPTLTPTPPYPPAQSSTWVTQAMLDKFCVKRHSFSLHPVLKPKKKWWNHPAVCACAQSISAFKQFDRFLQKLVRTLSFDNPSAVRFYLYGDHPFVWSYDNCISDNSQHH